MIKIKVVSNEDCFMRAVWPDEIIDVPNVGDFIEGDNATGRVVSITYVSPRKRFYDVELYVTAKY